MIAKVTGRRAEVVFFFSSRRRHTRWNCDWSSDVCSSDLTLVESWVYRLVGAPDKLYERALMYNRFINAPTSIVGHDDLEMYERAQEGLKSNGNQWVNLRRLYESHEEQDVTAVINGTSERQMRNQFHAWSKFMTMDMDKRVEAAE